MVPQLVKKFPAFYGIQMFIAMIMTAHHLSLYWARWIPSTPPPSYFLRVQFNISLPSMYWSSKMCLAFRYSNQNPVNISLLPHSRNLYEIKICKIVMIIPMLSSCYQLQWYSWKFRLSGMWHCVIRQVVPDIQRLTLPTSSWSSTPSRTLLWILDAEDKSNSPLKYRRLLVLWHSMTYWKTWIFSNITVLTSTLAIKVKKGKVLPTTGHEGPEEE